MFLKLKISHNQNFLDANFGIFSFKNVRNAVINGLKIHKEYAFLIQVSVSSRIIMEDAINAAKTIQ